MYSIDGSIGKMFAHLKKQLLFQPLHFYFYKLIQFVRADRPQLDPAGKVNYSYA